jgi:hypothetical protein
VGTDVPVQPIDNTTQTGPVTLVFANVLEPGITTLVISGAGIPPPCGFKLGDPPTYFEIHTTTVYTGTITVVIDYSNIAYHLDTNLKVFHWEYPSWNDVMTTIYPANHLIYGIVKSLSPFAASRKTFRPSWQLGPWKFPIPISPFWLKGATSIRIR